MLGGTEIDNEALNYISKIPNLKFLNVSWTKVTDDGLEYLKDNQSIEVLSLNGNKITKTGIKSISKMKKLKILSMEDILLSGDYSRLQPMAVFSLKYQLTFYLWKRCLNTILLVVGILRNY